jgi:tagatose-6-phosphate ketose/aldose isomerase
MKILGYSPEELKMAGAIDTGNEISGQPELWKKTLSLFEKQKEEINGFLTSKIHAVDEILLTGAGTSAFIGLSLKGIYQRITGKITESISTTDLVTHPEDYLMKDKSVLLISFARSGNSPESVAAARLADILCKKVIHVIISCDKNGHLANYQSDSEKFVFILPPESNDQSLAMTGSYTSMLLAGILMVGYDTLPNIGKQIETVCTYGERILNDYAGKIKTLVMKDFSRAVFLGSGPLFGTATESGLKLQELTDGKIICKNDSFLGFRHGPKAVVDEKTLVVYLFSNSEYVRQYETDLIKSMRSGKHPMLQIGICEYKIDIPNMDLLIVLSEKPNQISEELLTVCQIIPGQLIGFYKSLHLGNKPDSPSDSGSISRVVQGVDIYDYDKR